MKQRKIFIGVSLPEHVKKRLMTRIEQWKNLPIRWSYGENLHMTLLFIGYINDEAVAEICANTRRVAEETEGLDIRFGKITFGPDNDNPRMLWLSGEADEKLKNFVASLEEGLGVARTFRNVFRPHVTLGRIRQTAWQSAGWRTKKPDISGNFPVSLSVDAVEIIESTLENGKRKFITLESCPLK